MRIPSAWHGLCPSERHCHHRSSMINLSFFLARHVWQELDVQDWWVDGCDCAEILNLIEEGKIDTTPLITHKFPLNEIEEAYRIFENRLDGVIKVAIEGISSNLSLFCRIHFDSLLATLSCDIPSSSTLGISASISSLVTRKCKL